MRTSLFYRTLIVHACTAVKLDVRDWVKCFGLTWGYAPLINRVMFYESIFSEAYQSWQVWYIHLPTSVWCGSMAQWFRCLWIEFSYWFLVHHRIYTNDWLIDWVIFRNDINVLETCLTILCFARFQTGVFFVFFLLKLMADIYLSSKSGIRKYCDIDHCN